MDPKAKRSRLLEMAAAVSPGGPGRQTETPDEQRRRMAADLLKVADASVVAATKGGDPTKVAVALGNAQKAVELAERLAPPTQTARGHTVLVQVQRDDDADGDDAAADPQDPVQQATG